MTRSALVLAALAPAVLLGTTSARGSAAPAAASLRTTLPLVIIDVKRRIPDAPKVPARMRIIHNPGGTNSPRERANAYDGLIGIEVRGHSSARFPKRSYAIETRTARRRARNVPLLGMPRENDWILYASYNDKSLLRNVVAHWTARQLGRYSSRTRYVELVVDGRYEGVYVLMERVKRSPRRVALSDVGLSGAYVVELSTNPRVRGKRGFFRLPVTGKPVEFYDPKRTSLRPAERAWMRRYIGQFEQALYGDAFADQANGYRRWLDVESAVDYVLLQELFKNQDALITSVFVAKGARTRLRLGPIWDFDLAMGNAYFYPAGVLEGWMLRSRPWASRLYRDPAFAAAMAARWRQLRSERLIERMLAFVDANARALEQPQRRNFRRWRILGSYVWPNSVDPATGQYPPTYAAEVRLLKNWLRRRAAWLDRNIGSVGS
ncbi:MAG: CotH kinase family protein [Thermoleophilia bacterium]|nr:CotH kinase family protein [Thermoleophilia bacterium]